MLKEQLLEEAQNIDASVELDSVFESVELSDEVKENFSTVFEAAVKANAVKLAETHIQQIAESADTRVETAVNERAAEFETKLSEEVTNYLDHLASEWLSENKVEVTKGIKSGLFESMLSGMKELFTEHNISIPEESVDVVAEMESELAENQETAAKLFEENVALNKQIIEMKRQTAIAESTSELTESQKEKVLSFAEGLQFNESFSDKLNSIVGMVKSSTKEVALEESDINTNDEGLNFETITEVAKPNNQKSIKDRTMAAYIAASKQ